MSAFLDLYWAQIGSQRNTPLAQILEAASTHPEPISDDEPTAVPAGIAEHMFRLIDIAPPGELEVDRFTMNGERWPYAREALHEAAFVGAWEIHHHAMMVWKPKVRAHVDALLAEAVATLAEIRKFENLFSLSDLGQSAEQFERLAQDRLQKHAAVKKAVGRPDNDHLRAIAEAVARVWAERSGRVIPRAGTKGPHALTDLLSAVSLDLFDRAQLLTTNHLRPKPGEIAREPRGRRQGPQKTA